ncbi:hypothetical protein MPH_01944 [Macrophomina phaseolina MS6]|uniref:Uncharacterized protein n=1 Tax=Macrophomina phaseolina (strain MS6) TaxID=1126212 RepID=K2S790_MACPH|nr:hypothetical protein MPH_01944 [Macrophomina phaseolina MS6]
MTRVRNHFRESARVAVSYKETTISPSRLRRARICAAIRFLIGPDLADTPPRHDGIRQKPLPQFWEEPPHGYDSRYGRPAKTITPRAFPYNGSARQSGSRFRPEFSPRVRPFCPFNYCLRPICDRFPVMFRSKSLSRRLSRKSTSRSEPPSALPNEPEPPVIIAQSIQVQDPVDGSHAFVPSVPRIPAFWKQENATPLPSPSLGDGVQGLSRARGRDPGLTVKPLAGKEGQRLPQRTTTAHYLHPSHANISRTTIGQSDAENNDYLAFHVPTPDTLPTFTAPDWTGETTPKPRTFSLRSTISHGSWKSWNNDRRIDSAISHQSPYSTPNTERRTYSMKSLSRRLSVRNEGNHRASSIPDPQNPHHEKMWTSWPSYGTQGLPRRETHHQYPKQRMARAATHSDQKA